MSIDIGQFLGNIQSTTYSSTGLNSLFSSIISTTILLCVIILIIVMTVYPCKKGTPMWVLGKLFFYIALASIIILSFHNGIIKDQYEKKYRDEKINDFTGGYDMNNPIYASDRIDIKPTVDVSQYHTDNYSSNQYSNPVHSNDDHIRSQSVTDILDNIGA